MQLLPATLHPISGILGVCAVLAMAGESASGAPQRSGWYVSAGGGPGWSSRMEQVGHNRDTICYPDSDCSNAPGGVPDGYRWHYDIESNTGAAFEVSVGRRFHRARLELSATQRKNDLDSEFSRINYLDGSPITSADNDIRSNSMASVGDLTMRTPSLNGYYDFPLAANRITPYLGAGLGLSFVEVSELQFHSDYTGTRRPSDPPLQSFNSRQDVDLSDTVLAKHLYAGADYRLSDKILLGLKLAYTLVGDIEDTSSYSMHPVEGLTNQTRFSGMDHWSLMLTFKYRLGD